MRVSRIPADQNKGPCLTCHDRAIIDVMLHNDRHLRFCRKCAKYLGDYLVRRVGEHDAKEPLPVPKASVEDNRGNR